jgi:FdhE protein
VLAELRRPAANATNLLRLKHMPLLAIPQPRRDELEATSRQRWAALRETRPDLAPAVELQQRLLAIVVAAGDALDSGRLPRLSLPPKYLAAKLARGVPIFAGEPIPVPAGLLKASLLRLCDALAAGGAGDSAAHIKSALQDDSMDAASLLTASLSRDQQAIRTGAVHRGLAPDLVWLLAELAASPFAHTLQGALLAPRPNVSADPLADAMRAWDHGYCPICGSWPALAEVADAHRVLRCSFCAAGWELNEYRCIYCGEHGEPFVTAAPDEERKDRRVEICGACQGYLKTIDMPALSPFPLVAITDMESMDLDLAAMEHGYSRPQLKEFAKR